MRQPSRKRPSSVTQGTTWLKCGGETGPNRKKPIPSSQNSLKTSNLSHRLSRETRSLGVERALRPCTPKQQKTKRFPMWILQACIRVLTSTVSTLWDSRELSIVQKTRTLTIILVSRKSISCLLNACSTPIYLSGRGGNLLFLFAGPVLQKR